MKYELERRVARSLLGRGLMTVTDVAGAAGVYHQLAAQWAAKIDAHAARRQYVFTAWVSALAILAPHVAQEDNERGLAVHVMRAGLALPTELAPLVGRDVQTLRLWARGAKIDAKAARRTLCADLWRTERTKIEAEQAEKTKQEVGRYEIRSGVVFDTWRGVWVGKFKKGRR
jgi:hypothetical protein